MSVITPHGVHRIREQISYITNGAIKDYKAAIEASAERGVNEGNDEYFTLLHESKKFEDQITELMKILNESEVLDLPVDNGRIQLGTTVKFRDEDTDKVSEIHILPEVEVTFLKNAVTPSSPMGSALMGRIAGDVVEFDTPARSRTLEIIDVKVNSEFF
jgi:transcription elongation factor GreA